jgi:hypothetical protein
MHLTIASLNIALQGTGNLWAQRREGMHHPSLSALTRGLLPAEAGPSLGDRRLERTGEIAA